MFLYRFINVTIGQVHPLFVIVMTLGLAKTTQRWNQLQVLPYAVPIKHQTYRTTVNGNRELYICIYSDLWTIRSSLITTGCGNDAM